MTPRDTIEALWSAASPTDKHDERCIDSEALIALLGYRPTVNSQNANYTLMRAQHDLLIIDANNHSCLLNAMSQRDYLKQQADLARIRAQCAVNWEDYQREMQLADELLAQIRNQP